MISHKIINLAENKKRPDGYDLGIIEINIKKRQTIFDYIKMSPNVLSVFVEECGQSFPANPKKEIIDCLVFSNRYGNYIIKNQYDDDELFNHIKTLGNNRYPYSITREYEAVKHLSKFKDSVTIDYSNIINDSDYASWIKYSFGIEFETSMGFIPEEKCFSSGLVPLRDGSISGTEYSTIVLGKGCKYSLDLLQQQLSLLKKYSVFNKECALHIHMGGFPVDEKAIFILHFVEYLLERSNYNGIIPRYSFHTSKYKKNCKDYCRKIDLFHSFDTLYEYFACQKYYGDLTQPHPNDVSKEHKWQISTRYYGLNLINMLCYNGPKTVEFRFLRPTFNYRKIRLWIMIFNAILLYTEELFKIYKNSSYSRIISGLSDIQSEITLINIIRNIYGDDPKIEFQLLNDMKILKEIVRLQEINNDYCGQSVDIENMILEDII